LYWSGLVCKATKWKENSKWESIILRHKFQLRQIETVGIILLLCADLRNCLKISRRENLLVETSIYELCFVPYGTKDMHIFINSTDLSFLTEQEN